MVNRVNAGTKENGCCKYVENVYLYINVRCFEFPVIDSTCAVTRRFASFVPFMFWFSGGGR